MPGRSCRERFGLARAPATGVRGADTETSTVEPSRSSRLTACEARVAVRRRARVVRHVRRRAARCASTLPTQPRSSPSSRSVTKRRAASREAMARPRAACGRGAASRRDRLARDRDQRGRARRRDSTMLRSVKANAAVAHHAVAVAGGIAGVAQVARAPPPCRRRAAREQPVDRRSAARFLGHEASPRAHDRRARYRDRGFARIRTAGSAKDRSSRRSASRAPPQTVLESVRHFPGRRHRPRRWAPGVKRPSTDLQERQVHLQRMLACMRARH